VDTIKDIEKHRALWADVAKKNDWYAEPFFVQLFIDPETGEVYDSVSFGGMTKDILHYEPKSCGDVDCPCFDGEQCYDDWKKELSA
jgi:hypothetical protein